MAARYPYAIQGTRAADWTEVNSSINHVETSPSSIPLDATLSELPFFPEEFTLSHLPFFSAERVDDLPLPPTPPSVCEECWRGPFAMHFGIAYMSPQDGEHYRSWPEKFTYVTSLDKLESRAYDEGCVWCRFIFESEHLYGGHDPNKITITVQSTTQNEVSGRNDQVLLVHIDGGHPDKFCIYAAPDGPAASCITTRSPILTDVRSPHTLIRARQLIDECIHKHELCKAAASGSPRLPARLLDCTNPTRPRLVSTPGGEHGEYVALSYVWGKGLEHTRYQTTRSNLSSYRHGIKRRVLPLTIRDAIYVTHKLGFRWLWVDSLCIIQDSDEDKAHEIGRMHHIYRYAHLTIVAGSAEGVGSGFLQKRSSPDNCVALPFICPPYPPSSVGCHNGHSAPQKLQVGQVYLTSSHDIGQVSGSDKLGSVAARAWCMQEYLLSPRALIFTPTTLLFRCLTANTASVGSSCYSMQYDIRIPTSLFLPRSSAPAAEPDSKDWAKMCSAWMHVVQDYTCRTASDESDKLVACAAIAEQFHCLLGSEYLAGLWRSDTTLLTQLLWHAFLPAASLLGCQHTRPAAYRAPSWSWAAIEGPVYFDSDRRYPSVALVEVTKCWVTLEDPALPFGRVTDGALVLCGTLVLCHGGLAGKREPNEWFIRDLPSFQQVRHQWQCGPEGLIFVEEDNIYPTQPLEKVWATMDCDVDELPERMWLVPLVREKSTRKDYAYGIILELAPPSHGSGSAPEKVRFRRIGHFWQPIEVAKPSEDFQEHPLWDPLTRAVEMGEPLWTDIEIV